MIKEIVILRVTADQSESEITKEADNWTNCFIIRDCKDFGYEKISLESVLLGMIRFMLDYGFYQKFYSLSDLLSGYLISKDMFSPDFHEYLSSIIIESVVN